MAGRRVARSPRRLALSLALALTPLAGARGQSAPATPAADPAPAGGLRPLCTDRPTKSTSPCTVDAGHVQIESDIFNVTVDRSDGLTTTTYLATNPTLKYGLGRTLDVEVTIAPLTIVTVGDHASGTRTTETGVGDLYLKLKWNLLGDDGGGVGFAIVPYLKAPTAKLGIGNGAVEGGVIAPINLPLPLELSLVIDPELDILKDASGDSHHLNTSGLLSFSRPLTKAITLSAEIWVDQNFDPSGATTQASADFGIAWIPHGRPNLQFDGGVNLGLTQATPGLQAYVGISKRF